jgi:hypothetical protein
MSSSKVASVRFLVRCTVTAIYGNETPYDLRIAEGQVVTGKITAHVISKVEMFDIVEASGRELTNIAYAAVTFLDDEETSLK